MNAPAGDESVGRIPSCQAGAGRSRCCWGPHLTQGVGAQVPPRWRSLSRSDSKLCLDQIPRPGEFIFLEKDCLNEEVGIMTPEHRLLTLTERLVKGSHRGFFLCLLCSAIKSRIPSARIFFPPSFYYYLERLLKKLS